MGTLILNNKKFELLLPRESRYYFGRATPAALRPALKVDFDPQILVDVLFDRAPSGKAWSCSYDSEKRPLECQNKTSRHLIRFDRANADRRRVLVQSSKFELQLALQEGATKVEPDSSWLSLSVPADYQKKEFK